MKTEIFYLRFVKIDLKEINLWYRKIDLKLWQSFLKEYRLKINSIRENPLFSEVKYDVTRIVFLKKNSRTEFIISLMMRKMGLQYIRFFILREIPIYGLKENKKSPKILNDF